MFTFLGHLHATLPPPSLHCLNAQVYTVNMQINVFKIKNNNQLKVQFKKVYYLLSSNTHITIYHPRQSFSEFKKILQISASKDDKDLEKKGSKMGIIIRRRCIIKFVMSMLKQGRKRPLDTPKRIIERREREGERERESQKEKYREGGRDKRERERERERQREREVKGIERERVKGRVKSS